MKREKLFWGFAVGLVAIVILIGGCATMPPVKPIKDFKDIAGTWEGSFITHSGMEIPYISTFREDGTYTSKRPGRTDNRTLKLTKDGKAVNTREGTFTLHEGDGKRVLSFSNPRGSGQYTPVK